MAVLTCLLAGCGTGRQIEEQSTSADDLTDLFNQSASGMEVASFNYGWPDERDVFTYSGKSLEIPFMMTGMVDASSLEVGLLLFVDGIAQPYSVVLADGTELTEAYMQTFHLENDMENIFDLVFQPVTGKSGDRLSIQAITILKPSYLPEGAENPNYGFYHAANLTIPLQISFEKDAPAEGQPSAASGYEITDIPKSITDSNEYFGMENTLDTNNYLSIVPAEDESNSVIYAKDGSASFKIRLFGGPEADNNITVFINHQPIRINDADYLAVHTQKGKMVEATITLDASLLGELNTIYAVASSTSHDSGLTETLKSESVLLINQEGN